ncbi:hypothetical protein EXE58_11790 [Nocardioides seonyuensis]|uniref:DUF732 domain-containing protein n=1 Tax=Nocardioides seonyuensis TaxID=2518371 RepID=A0A4P7IIL6_9ACTN|nr:hypothetical protein [Nocardioides seonyuensis]QBX56077.1 hypothetical protein EXE58_11790 [Nocardioides seonyuensis]
MKRLAASVAALGAVASISGCAVSERDQFEYDGVDDETAQTLYLQDQLLLMKSGTLRGEEWTVWVLGTTERICESFDEGVTLKEMARFAKRELGVTDGRQFVGNAAGFACPQHLSRF